MFKNLAPILKCFTKDTSKLFACILENFNKNGFVQNSAFQKWIYENYFLSFFKMLCKLTKFLFSKSKNWLQEGHCFQMKTFLWLLPYLAKRKRYFVSKRKLLPKENRCLRKNRFPNGFWTCFTKFWCEKCFQQNLNLFPKNLWLREQNDFKRKSKLDLWKFQKLFWEMTFLKKHFD